MEDKKNKPEQPNELNTDEILLNIKAVVEQIKQQQAIFHQAVSEYIEHQKKDGKKV